MKKLKIPRHWGLRKETHRRGKESGNSLAHISPKSELRFLPRARKKRSSTYYHQRNIKSFTSTAYLPLTSKCERWKNLLLSRQFSAFSPRHFFENTEIMSICSFSASPGQMRTFPSSHESNCLMTFRPYSLQYASINFAVMSLRQPVRFRPFFE